MTISVADNAAAAALPPATPAAVDPAAAPVAKKPKPCCSCPETKVREGEKGRGARGRGWRVRRCETEGGGQGEDERSQEA